MTVAEIVSNIFASIALIVSFVGWYRESRAQKRAHEFDLFRDVYQDFLIKRLPEARDRIRVTVGGTVSQTDALIDELRALRKASIYFKYAEPQFFEELRDKLWALEDYLVELPDHVDNGQRKNFDGNVSQKLKDIYQYILKKF